MVYMSELEKLYKEMVDQEDELTGFKAGVCFCGEEGYHSECLESLRPIVRRDKQAESYFETLGYASVDVANGGFKKAELSLFSQLEFDPFEIGYKSKDVLENRDTYYFPIVCVGCCGYLVTKEDLEVISFGSYVGRIEHIWAYYEGAQLASLGKDRNNSLIIKEVRDAKRTLKVLKSFLDNNYVNSIEPEFRSLPIVLDNVDIYFGIRDLFDARMKNWFEFEIV